MINRTCRGYVQACIFLNLKELEGLRRLLDSYIATEETDPYLPQLKRLYNGIKEGRS